MCEAGKGCGLGETGILIRLMGSIMAILTKTAQKQGHDAINSIINGYFMLGVAVSMVLRRIAMCEQARTGMHMMRGEWRKLGDPAATYKKNQPWKAFEFFIAEQDKEVDVASDLVKTMFGSTPQVAPQVTSEVTPEVRLLHALAGEMSRQNLQASLGLKCDEHFRKAYPLPALRAGLIEMTIPDKPRSSKLKYQMTDRGELCLAEAQG